MMIAPIYNDDFTDFDRWFILISWISLIFIDKNQRNLIIR